VTLLLAAAATLLLFGSYLVIRVVIESDSDADAREVQPAPLPMSETRDVAPHRRAA
jgi:hypothetical protein